MAVPLLREGSGHKSHGYTGQPDAAEASSLLGTLDILCIRDKTWAVGHRPGATESDAGCRAREVQKISI